MPRYRGARSKTRTKSRNVRARSSLNVTRFRTRKTTSRYAIKASSRKSRAKVRPTSIFYRKQTITRTQRPRRQTPRTRLVKPRIYQTVKTQQNRIPRINNKSSVWSNNPPKLLRTRCNKGEWYSRSGCRPINPPTPNRIKLPIGLYQGYQQKNNPIGFSLNNDMLNPSQRYMPPVELDLFPRPQYQAYAQSDKINQTNVMAGKLPSGKNLQMQFESLKQSPYILYGGIGFGALILLKIIMGRSN
jgi:hypothetical protein